VPRFFRTENHVNAPRVGGDVDAYCTRCRMLLGHTVLAMVGPRIAKVRCNTCQGEHAFKSGAPGTPAPRAAAEPRTRRTAAGTRAPREKVAALPPVEDLLAGRDPSAAVPYSPKVRFAAGALIHHPTFGLGVVQADRGDKVDVAFRAGVKTLVHGHGEAGKAPVEFDKSRRAAPSGGAADKPPGD
jgi:hypothetical protein